MWAVTRRSMATNLSNIVSIDCVWRTKNERCALNERSAAEAVSGVIFGSVITDFRTPATAVRRTPTAVASVLLYDISPRGIYAEGRGGVRRARARPGAAG